MQTAETAEKKIGVGLKESFENIPHEYLSIIDRILIGGSDTVEGTTYTSADIAQFIKSGTIPNFLREPTRRQTAINKEEIAEIAAARRTKYMVGAPTGILSAEAIFQIYTKKGYEIAIQTFPEDPITGISPLKWNMFLLQPVKRVGLSSTTKIKIDDPVLLKSLRPYGSLADVTGFQVRRGGLEVSLHSLSKQQHNLRLSTI